MKSYSFITGSRPFIPDQLKALTAGDDFHVDDWDKKFKVKYTPFRTAMHEIVHDKYDKYSSEMVSPN